MKKLNIKFINYLILVGVFFFSFLIVGQVFAAEMFIEAKTNDVKAGQLFEIGIFIDTENENINAIEGKLTFPQDLLELKSIDDGNSIINFWIEEPKIASDSQNGEVVFSGITPNGFTDARGWIFSATFEAKKDGENSIKLSDARALLNDGKGTEATLTISDFKPSPGNLLPAEKDIDAPDEFVPEITSDPNVFDGKWFVVFNTQDKGTGIDHYAVQETQSEAIKSDKWVIAKSPYLLTDQNLNSYIYVEAVDKSGNERIAVIPPRNPITFYRNFLKLAAIAVGAITVSYISVILWKNNHSKIS